MIRNLVGEKVGDQEKSYFVETHPDVVELMSKTF